MASIATELLVRQIGSLFDGTSVAAMSDRQLLDRFASRRDAAGEAAFAAVVRRHGPMVLGVCNEFLHDRHDAEDAFQAVFLVLARKAHLIRDLDLLGNWLYGVTIRTCRHLRHQRVRRRKHEAAMPVIGAASSIATSSSEQAVLTCEQAELLHDEILACHVRSDSPSSSAISKASPFTRPPGASGAPMARSAAESPAREKLKRGLSRRGIVLPAAALAAALSSRTAAASVPPRLCETTAHAAMEFAAGLSVAPVAQEVLRSLLVNKLKLTAVSLLLIAAGAMGALCLAPAAVQTQDRKIAPPVAKSSDAALPVDRTPQPGRMFVTGRVLDPSGKEMAGVPIEIVGRPREPWVPTTVDPERHRVLGRGLSTADGRFSLEASRTSFTRFFEVYALAAAPGFGLGWAELNANAGEPTVEIRLLPEQVIRGKLFDVNGQPAPSVKLQIWSVGHPTQIGTFDGVSLGNAHPPDALRNWPQPVTTDDQGRFTLAGIGHDVTVGISVRDGRFAEQNFRIQTDDRDGPKEFSQTLQTATVIDGQVLAADTGEPISGTVISMSSGVHVRADDHGHYITNVRFATRYRAEVFPPEGTLYLAIQQDVSCPKGTVKKTQDFKLPRGVLLRGKVIEQGSGRPLPAASVQWIAVRPKSGVIEGWQAVVATKDDGSYQIVVPPGKGHLFVYGPTSDYVLQMIGSRMLYEGKPGGERYYAHDIIPWDVKAGDSPHEMISQLRPGMIVKGRLVGPAGQTVDKAEIVALLHFNYFHLNWRGDLTIHARDGSFELHGLDPEKTTRVSFLDADHQWGATVELSGKQSAKDVEVQLLPCGQAKARFVTPDGKPIPKISPQLEILGSSGPSSRTRTAEAQAQLAADAAAVVNLDRKHYWNGMLTDADGRIALPSLIPGATYRINDWSTVNDENKGVQVRKDFSVKPGETLDLGDILIEKPPR